jgi:hypothetical protein
VYGNLHTAIWKFFKSKSTPIHPLFTATIVILLKSAPFQGEKMTSMLRSISLVLSVVCFVCWSVPCRAAENVFKEVLTDSLYGGLSGTLVGAAVMAFAKRSGDHLDYMAYGAATGVLVGAAYGLGRAMVEMDKGKMTLSVPTIMPDIQDTNSKGQTPIVVMTELVHGKF